MEPSKRERDHGSDLIRVDFRVSFVSVMRTIEIFNGIEFCGGFVETTEFSESEGVEGEIGEVVMGFLEKGKSSGACNFVDDGTPRAAVS